MSTIRHPRRDERPTARLPAVVSHSYTTTRLQSHSGGRSSRPVPYFRVDGAGGVAQPTAANLENKGRLVLLVVLTLDGVSLRERRGEPDRGLNGAAPSLRHSCEGTGKWRPRARRRETARTPNVLVAPLSAVNIEVVKNQAVRAKNEEVRRAARCRRSGLLVLLRHGEHDLGSRSTISSARPRHFEEAGVAQIDAWTRGATRSRRSTAPASP